MRCLHLLIALFLLSTPAQAKELKIFAKIDGAPKHYQDPDGSASGYAVDIAVEAVKRAGYNPVVVNTAWKRAQNSALNGKGIITAFSKTREREARYLFTKPLYEDRVLLIKRVDRAFDFESYADLSGKKVGISRGSTYGGEFAEKRNQLTLEEDNGHRHRLIKLAHGRLDAGIFPGDRYLFAHNARQLDFDLSMFSIADKPIAIDPNFLGVPMNIQGFDANTLTSKLNKAITHLYEDGTIEKILEKYR